MREAEQSPDRHRIRADIHAGDTSAWLVSLLVHFLFLIAISLLSIQVRQAIPPIVLTSTLDDDTRIEDSIPETFHFDPTPQVDIGGLALGGLTDETVDQQLVPDLAEVPSIEIEARDHGLIEARELIHAASGPTADLNHAIKGAAGIAVTGADGAIDRITQELLLSLDERKTLVVWFFDQSGSLQTQRDEVSRRFRRVYDELGVIQSSGNAAFARHQDKPLLTSVVAFGSDVQIMIERPTDDLAEITSAVDSIELDDSGVERVFSAFYLAADRFKKYRTSLDRNVIFVAFTDEAGDDQEGLDRTVSICRRLSIPVYVIGVPAPFGRRETLVKWVDPDPNYDQSTQWGRVDQGPESLLPERIRIELTGFREDTSPIDSGFGPFALTRLCYETGGMYFTVHPNRQLERIVRRGETKPYAAHFAAFFDPIVMRRYRPEYVSAEQYRENLRQSRLRTALVQAAEMSWVRPLDQPRQRFVVRSESQLANELTEAQKDAARITPTLQKLTDILAVGEDDRQREIAPRWQAGYDLAMGRVLANRVRAEGYNAMLAQAKRGLKFQVAKNNTWQLNPIKEVEGDSRLQRDADRAQTYLSRVVQDHAGTPWALLAKRELDRPLGWKWTEAFTPVDPPSNRVAANNNNPNPAARDDQARVIERRQRRPPPKL